METCELLERPSQMKTTNWDEPATAGTPRGWYWPKGTTTPGKTVCAGHYLDYGPSHKRFDGLEHIHPGHIHAVALSRNGRSVSSRYFDNVASARQWVESQAKAAGHRD